MRYRIEVTPDGEDTQNYYFMEPGEVADFIRANILRGATDPRWQLDRVRYQVSYGANLGITRMPFPYLVDPISGKQFPLFATEADLSMMSQDGYLVPPMGSSDSSFSEEDLGVEEPVAEAVDSSELLAESGNDPADIFQGEPDNGEDDSDPIDNPPVM